MNFQQDWFMRQIEGIVAVLAKLILGKDVVKYEIRDEAKLTETDYLYKSIMSLVSKREICKAEDLLLENLDVGNKGTLEAALDFYQTIALFSDKELAECNFSRSEVRDGLIGIARLLGVEEALPED